jgi:hypothetical protein
MAHRLRNPRRPFDSATVDRAFRRQTGRCALCGKRLYDEDDRPRGKAWHAHHANGDRSDVRLGNCVLVCENSCHLAAHLDDFNGEYVLDHSAYPYRNAEDFSSPNEPLQRMALARRR